MEQFSFAQLSPNRLYKNVNTFDDQWYMKIRTGKKDDLVTCSKYSNQTFSTSSATRTGKVFVLFNNQLTTR